MVAHARGQATGDFDQDGTVAICDAAVLPACLSGPDGDVVPDACLAFDANGDGHVDLHDFAAFQRIFDAAPRLVNLPDRLSVMESALLVARHWINGNPNPGAPSWDRSTCFEGIVGLYHQLAEPELYDYAVLWAENNGWSLWGGRDHAQRGQPDRRPGLPRTVPI